jgi:hypothetical protein
MGFNLAMFFAELEMILSDQEYTEAQKVEAIADLVADERRYATECGQLTPVDAATERPNG